VASMAAGVALTLALAGVVVAAMVVVAMRARQTRR